MGRGKGGRASGSRRDGLFLDYDFEIFIQDDNGRLRTPGNNSTFVGAIEDFELNIQGSNFDFDNDIEPTTNIINDQELIGDSFNIPTIESLDLTASTEGSLLLYSISSPGTELTSFGIERLIIGVDIDGEVTLPNGEALDIDQATTNIEYIINNELLELPVDDDNRINIEARVIEDGSISTQLIESNNIQSSNFEPISVDEDPVLLPGNLNDLLDALTGQGVNLPDAKSGGDTLIVDESNQVLFGGEGDDLFYVTSGGNNAITGGAGADQFWIATTGFPDATNTITDFTIGEDVIGIAGLGGGFGDVNLTQQGDDALIAIFGNDLALLQDIDITNLSESDFVFG